MSGHSKWSTIKHKKEATDIARGKLFSKLSKSISAAVKAGGGSNPETNSKLRYAIEQAKSANMPKSNIDRALKRGESSKNLSEVTYEGFGPGGTKVIVEVTTDNRNRSGQEIKSLFERGGGNLAGPGSVSFNFVKKGLIVIEKEKDVQEQMLKLIDAGVDDIEEVEDGIEVYTSVDKIMQTLKNLGKQGYSIKSHQIIQKPIALQKINDKNIASKILKFLDNLEEQDDVQMVFADIDIPNKIVEKLNS